MMGAGGSCALVITRLASHRSVAIFWLSCVDSRLPVTVKRSRARNDVMDLEECARRMCPSFGDGSFAQHYCGLFRR